MKMEGSGNTKKKDVYARSNTITLISLLNTTFRRERSCESDVEEAIKAEGKKDPYAKKSPLVFLTCRR